MTAAPRTIAHYELLERIGSGGMGTVWRAYDVDSGDIVALKVLHPHVAANPDGVKRFEREAAIASSMQSSHVVRVIEWGSDRDEHYLAMEYIRGPTLADKIRVSGKLPFDEVIALTAGMAQALAVAHRLGTVHRDIKPDNVLIAADGTPKIMDFGVSWALGQATMTMTGMYVGTPAYMAPDLSGRRRVDIRADIYSLGIVMYEMLTGSVPFSASTPLDVIRLHETKIPPPIEAVRSDTPAGLAAICNCCLAKDPADRFQSPDELLQAIGQPERFSSRKHRRGNASGALLRTASAGIAVVAIGALILAGAVYLTRSGADDAKAPSPTIASAPLTAPIFAPEASAPAEPPPASVPSPVTPQEATSDPEIVPDGLPDRADCNAIRGTPYRSGSEYSWFWTNCSGGSGPAPTAASTSSRAPTSPQPAAPANGSTTVQPKAPAATGGAAPVAAPPAAPQAATSAAPVSIAAPSGAFSLPGVASTYGVTSRVTFDDNASLKPFFTSTTGVALGGDGTVRLNGINGWSTYMGYGTGFKPGEGLVLFFSYDSVAQTNLMLQTASNVAQFNTDGYRRFGISIPKASPRVDLWQGKQALGGNPSLWKGGWTPQAGRWYGLFLGVTPGGQFRALLWDRDNPASVLEYSEPVGEKWKATEWRFLAQANNGLLAMDDFARVTVP